MKVRERIRKSWKRKGWKYSAAGLLCLTAAVCVFALGMGSRVQAAATEVTLGGQKVTLNTDADGAYLIGNEAQLQSLGKANAEETKEKTFRLASDLDVGEVTEAAAGSFAGTFDGAGHVITIASVDITSTAAALNTGEKGSNANEGILFGTVSGTVKNVIVDIEGNASYHRTSNAGVTVTGNDTTTETQSGEAEYQGGPFSELDQDKNAYTAIDGYEDVYLDADGKEVEEGTAGAEPYKKAENHKVEKTFSSYNINAVGEDSFGIVCGELTATGSVQQVLVNGEALTVEQAVEETSITDTQITTPFSHYYKVGEMQDTKNPVNAGNVSFSASNIYDSDTVTSPETANAAVGSLFKLQVSAQKTVLAGGKIDYTVRISPEADVDLSSVKITADTAGTWTGGIVSSDGQSVTVTDFANPVTYQVNAAEVGDKKVSFTAETLDANGQRVQATAEVSVKVVESGEQASTKASNEPVAEGTLTLHITHPKTVELSGGSVSWNYTVTAESQNGIPLKDVVIQCPENVTLKNGATLPEGMTWNETDKTVTIPTLDANATSEEITFSRTSTREETVKAVFSASAMTAAQGKPEQKVLTEGETSVTVWKETAAEEITSNATATLKLEVSARENIGSTGIDGKIKYEVTVTPLEGKTPTNVQITAAPPTGSTGEWTTNTNVGTASENVFTISTLSASQTLTYTCSGVTPRDAFTQTFTAKSAGTPTNVAARAEITTKVWDTSVDTKGASDTAQKLKLQVFYPQSCSSDDKRIYTVTMTNSGTDSMTGLTLTYPDGVSPASGTSTKWTNDATNHKLKYQNTLAGSSSVTVSFTCSETFAGGNFSAAADIEGAASVSSVEKISGWGGASDQTVTDQTTGLSLSASAPVEVSKSAKTIDYTVTVKPLSNGQPQNVKITANIPDGCVDTWQITDGTTTRISNEITIANLTGTKILTFTRTVNSSLMNGSLSQEFSAVSTETGAAYPVTVTAETTVTANAASTGTTDPVESSSKVLGLQASAPQEIGSTGTEGSIAYTITLTPPANSTLSNVKITPSVLSGSGNGTGTWTDKGGGTVDSITGVLTLTLLSAETTLTYTRTGMAPADTFEQTFTAVSTETGGENNKATAKVSTKINDTDTDVKTDNSKPYLGMTVSYPKSAADSADKVYTVTVTNKGAVPMTGVTLTHPAGVTFKSGTNWITGTETNTVTYSRTIVAKGTATAAFTYNGTDTAAWDGKFSVKGKGSYTTGGLAVAAIAKWNDQSNATPKYYVSDDLLDTNYAVDGNEESLLVKASVEPTIKVIDGKAQITYQVQVENKSSTAIKKDVTISPSTNKYGTWRCSTGHIIKKGANGAVIIQAPIEKAANVVLTYTCNRDLTGNGVYDASEKFSVSRRWSPSLSISIPNTSVYDISNIMVTAGNPATAADQLTMQSKVAKNKIVSADDQTLTYRVTVNAPQGKTVTLTAVPSGISECTGTWGEATENTKVVTGTGADLDYTYTCTIPESASGTVNMAFTAFTADQMMAVQTENISTTVYPKTLVTADGSNGTIGGGILTLQASADSVLDKSADSQTEVIYTLQVTRPADKDVTIMAWDGEQALSGKWGTTEEAAKAAADSQTAYTLKANSEGTVYFVRSVDVSDLGNGDSMTVQASFQMKQEEDAYTAQTAKTDAVATDIYSHDSTIAVATTADSDRMLSAALKMNRRYETPTKKITYTLELTNQSAKYPLLITPDLEGWSNSKGSASNIRLEPGQSVSLTKEDTNITVTPSANRILTTYTYEKDKSATGAPEQKDVDVQSIYAGNTLYAGALAGKNAGSIGQCAEDIEISGTAFSKPEGAVLAFGGDEKALPMAVGGAVGSGSADMADLYIKGTASVAGNAGAKSADVAGNGTGTLKTSIVTAVSDTLNLGMTAADVKTGIGAVPDDSWTNWKKFRYAESVDSMQDSFDLWWLVRDEEGVFTYTTDKTASSVQTEVSQKLTDRDLSYRSVYQARKQLADQEAQSYFSDTDMLELGDSGYYRNVHTYAGDGFYHYVQDYGENAQMVYPYTDQKPVFTADPAWGVLRDKDSLTDQIVMNLVSSIDTEQLEIWYDNAGTTAVINDKLQAVFPFDKAEVQVTAVPVWKDKIYEEIPSEVFDKTDREPLPGPGAEVTGYYTASGEPKPEAFVPGAVCQVGSTLKLNSMKEGCSYQLGFSANAPESWNQANWQKNDTDAYPAWTKDADKITMDWTAYIDSAVIPETLSGTQYLYVKVSKENYPDTVYCLGNFTADAKASGSPQMYYDYEADAKTGTKVPEGSRIAEGDMLVFEMNPADRLKKLEYVLSDRALSGTALYGADWKTYDAPVILKRPSESFACYLYTRMKDESEGDIAYGPIASYEYTFAGENTGIQASPRTVPAQTEQDTGTSVPSGTPVYLDSMDKDVKILYLVNNSLAEDIRLERVSGSVAGLTEDGRHFKAGERWYRINREGVQVFTDKVMLYNDQNVTGTQYVHAAVLGTDLEPGEPMDFVYQVQPTEQAAAPEATLATQNFPNGAETAVAEVDKDAHLSFTSLTPGAELYYVIGNGTVEDHEDAATGTKKYDPSVGIQVEGEYGSQFIVSIKAVKRSADGTRKELKDSATVSFVYLIAEQENALTPTSTPVTAADAPAVVLPGEKILLSTATRGAAIYYTVDGSEPKVEQGEDGSWKSADAGTMLYDAGVGISMPTEGSGYFTIGAVAVKTELGKSPAAKFVYAFPSTVQSPYTNIPSGSVDMGTEILLKNRTDGAAIYYTMATDGKTPDDPTISSAVFDEEQPIIINGETVIKAMAVKDGVKSEIVTFKFGSMDQLSAPEASINSGAMVSRGTKLTLSAADGATIYYTMDGSDPSETGNAAAIAGKELTLDGEPGGQVTVKAYARMDGKSASEVVTFTYQISRSAAGVTADVPSGTLVSNGSKVNLMTDVTDADIYYTTDGSDPTDNGTKGTVVTVNGTSGGTFTIKAVAVVDGDDGTIATFTYKIKEKPTAPTASPSGGVLTIATRVELSSSADKIYYTTDGTTPTESSSLYKEPILINRTTQLQAIAVSEDGEVSDVAAFQYTAAQKADTPTASHEDNAVLEPGTIVALSTDTDGAVIYYSTDGTEPTLDNLEDMLEYPEEGITVNRTVTIKAAAYREDMQLSSVGTFNYIVETIPAVEMKEAEEEKLAAEGLHETDASGLEREDASEGTAYQSRVLREKEHDTVVSSAWSAIPADAVLVTEEVEYASAALKNVKQIFGEDYVILSSYDIYLMKGGTKVQPTGDVELGIPIPKEYLDAAVTIVYIDSDNKITRQETRRQNGMAYAKVGHFSHYGLVGLEEEADAGRSLNFLLILECVAGLAAILGIGYAIRQKWKKFRQNR